MNFASPYESLFFQSLRIRLVEQKIIDLYPSDKIQSPVHMSIGQEAVATGTCRSLRSNDIFFPTYRSHAFYLAKGGCLKKMFAELYGKGTGGAGGKAGSMHLMAPEVGFMTASAVVASMIPLGVGAAIAVNRKGGDAVVVTNFGDGATEEGVFHESLNAAALFPGPVIFLCEDNGLAVHSKRGERHAYDINSLVAQYGIAVTEIMEGWDPVAVDGAFSEVVAQVRTTRRPHFVRVHTCRYKEHVGPGEDFDAGYRSRADVEAWMAKDPLMTDRALVERFTPVIAAEIEEAVQFAEESPWPTEASLVENV